MKQIYLCLFIFATLFYSCGPNINKQQEEKLEQLTTSVDSIAEMVNAIDSNKIAESVEMFFTHRSFLQNEMKDTLSRDVIFKLDKYLGLKKSMQYLRSEYINILSEANIMKKQLEDLNKDVANRLIDSKKFETYYELELENFKELKDAANRLNNVKEKSLPTFEKTTPFVDSLINAYKQRLNE